MLMTFFLQIPHICIILSGKLDILTFLMINVANIYFRDLTRLINFHLGRLTKNMLLTKNLGLEPYPSSKGWVNSYSIPKRNTGFLLSFYMLECKSRPQYGSIDTSNTNIRPLVTILIFNNVWKKTYENKTCEISKVMKTRKVEN